MDYFLNFECTASAKKNQSKAKPFPAFQLLVGMVGKECKEDEW